MKSAGAIRMPGLTNVESNGIIEDMFVITRVGNINLCGILRRGALFFPNSTHSCVILMCSHNACSASLGVVHMLMRNTTRVRI